MLSILLSHNLLTCRLDYPESKCGAWRCFHQLQDQKYHVQGDIHNQPWRNWIQYEDHLTAF